MVQNTMATPLMAVSRSDLLRTIMREHRDGLVSYAEKMLGDHGLAEDIVQETIIRAWRNIDHLLGMEGSVRGWLFAVTRHLVIDWVRKPHAHREVIGVTNNDPVSGADSTEAVHDALVAKPLLYRLSPEHRAVLMRATLVPRFKKTVGRGPYEYLTQWRIELAAERLRQGRDTVASIALSVGYGSDSALSTAFKRVMGTSPRAYRQHRPWSAQAVDVS